jgi:hypothetical protein
MTPQPMSRTPPFQTVVFSLSSLAPIAFWQHRPFAAESGETTMTGWREREELISKRNLLFRRFLFNPRETHLAVEVKALDDQIAESIQRMLSTERNAESRIMKSAKS